MVELTRIRSLSFRDRRKSQLPSRTWKERGDETPTIEEADAEDPIENHPLMLLAAELLHLE